ncbi:hypothetical protein BaRGS_00015963 [Batillaria attramentaria]|uniref:Uncharacterized protein n=1 Tax=Batillaria attramentaria TaxID=370345 RepID=A0ABD0L0D1_9CAEN
MFCACTYKYRCVPRSGMYLVWHVPRSGIYLVMSQRTLHVPMSSALLKVGHRVPGAHTLPLACSATDRSVGCPCLSPCLLAGFRARGRGGEKKVGQSG